MDQQKKDLIWICMLGFILVAIILIFHWIVAFQVIILEGSIAVSLLQKVLMAMQTPEKLFYVRLACLGFICATSIFQKFRTNTHAAKKALCIVPIFICVYLYGYSENINYGLYIYPIAFIGTLVLLPIAISCFLNQSSNDDKPIGINKKTGANPFHIPLNYNSPLVIPNINSHVMGEGGAGTGKTQSLVIPALRQYIKEGRAGIIYDYEGDITLGGSAAYITKAAYTMLKQSNSKVRFAMISMADVSRTVRVNPISPNYIKSFQHALDISASIVYNLNPELATPDKKFWAENSIYAIAGTIYHFVTKKPEMATLAHVIEFLASDFETALKILSLDKEVAPYIRPVLAPILRQGAGGQAAGASATTQFSVVKLRSKEAYYILSPTPKQEMNLDITDKNNPILLSLAASKPDSTIIPVLGSILQVCKTKMNLPGKQKAFILIDELPTIIINEIEQLMAVIRKHGVSVFLTFQTFTQLVKKYGNESAKIVVDNCAAQFVGRTSVESAERVCKLMGEYKKTEINHTYNDSSTNSQSIRTPFDKVMRINEITAQPDGHFTGKVGGGEPDFFHTQLKGEVCNVEDIPPFNPEMIKEGKALSKGEVDKIVIDNFLNIIDETDQYIRSYFKTIKQ